MAFQAPPTVIGKTIDPKKILRAVQHNHQMQNLARRGIMVSEVHFTCFSGDLGVMAYYGRVFVNAEGKVDLELIPEQKSQMDLIRKRLATFNDKCNDVIELRKILITGTAEDPINWKALAELANRKGIEEAQKKFFNVRAIANYQPTDLDREPGPGEFRCVWCQENGTHPSIYPLNEQGGSDPSLGGYVCIFCTEEAAKIENETETPLNPETQE